MATQLPRQPNAGVSINGIEIAHLPIVSMFVVNKGSSNGEIQF